MDFNNLQKDKKIGTVTLPLSSFETEPELKNIWKQIQRDNGLSPKGEINFDAGFYPIEESNSTCSNKTFKIFLKKRHWDTPNDNPSSKRS